MSTTVRYQKYQLSRASGKKIIETDFSEDLAVEEKDLQQVARDLANFSNNTKEPVDYSSVLEIKTSDDVIKIERNYKDGTSKLTSEKQSDPNFFWLPDDIAEHAIDDKNPFVLYPFTEKELKEKLLTVLPNLQKLGLGDKELRSPEEIKAELQQIGGENLTKLSNTDQEITKIQQDLDKQREVDQAQLSVADLEGQVEDILGTLESVEDLVEAQKGVYEKLKQYSKNLGQDVVEKAERIKKHMEELREKKLKYESELIKVEKVESAKGSEDGKDRPRIANFLLFMPVILMILSLLGFVITRNLYVIALGIIGGILEALLYLAINAVEPSIDLDKVNLHVVSNTKKSINPQFEMDAQKSKEIETFFINKAWLNVLKEEFAQLRQAIDNKLQGQNFAQMQTAKTEIETQLQRVRDLIASHEGKDIAPEEYLRLRRKLDMLKVEKSKIEKEIASIPGGDKLGSLQQELNIVSKLPPPKPGEQSIKLPNSFVSLVSDRYIAMKVDEQKQLSLFDTNSGSWVNDNLDINHLLGIYVFSKLLHWEMAPSLPVVLAGVVEKLPKLAFEQIDAKIKKLKTLGQVILVNKQQ